MHTTDSRNVWWRPNGRSPFALDPDRPALPQIASIIGQVGVILGGPLLAVIGIEHYPALIRDRTLYIGGLGSIALWFIASFAVFGDKAFPRGMPPWLKLEFRAGWALCMTAWVLGAGLIFNGYDTPLLAREVPVVAKRHTRQRDPANRTYYLEARVWPGSRMVQEIDAPRGVYERLDVPIVAVDTPQKALDAMPDAARLRLIVGVGRLGLEWQKQVTLP